MSDPAIGPPERRCPQCAAPTTEADQFCESCGADLAAPVEADGAPRDGSAPEVPGGESARTHRIELGAPAIARAAEIDEAGAAVLTERRCRECDGVIADDEYCSLCGARAISERDHWEERPTSWVGGVCDRGIRHARNEDAMALGADEPAGSRCVLVVCDGVTTAPDSDKASLAASIAARDALVTSHASAPANPSEIVPFWTAQIEHAVDLAHTEVVNAAAGLPPDALDPPSCTFVCAVLQGPYVVAGWIGDSRAYWLPDDGAAIQLSIDDSWATDQIAMGMPRAVAEADSRAHSITRWLGADNTNWKPRCSVATPETAGWLLVVSDGFWNYCSAASEVHDLVVGFANASDSDGGPHIRHPAEIAGELVAWSNAQGGHDNITAALARIPDPDAAPDDDLDELLVEQAAPRVDDV